MASGLLGLRQGSFHQFRSLPFLFPQNSLTSTAGAKSRKGLTGTVHPYCLSQASSKVLQSLSIFCTGTWDRHSPTCPHNLQAASYSLWHCTQGSCQLGGLEACEKVNVALVFPKWRGFSLFVPGLWTSATYSIDVSDIDGPVWNVIIWNLKSLYSCCHFQHMHSGMIPGSPLISPLCFSAQWVPSDLAAHSPHPPPLWTRGIKSALLPAEIPWPPSPCRSSLCTVPVPIAQTATSSFIWACQPFLCLFTLPSRSRAASCHVFWATCILISASSNLSLLWAFSMSCLSANSIFPCSRPSHFLWF